MIHEDAGFSSFRCVHASIKAQNHNTSTMSSNKSQQQWGKLPGPCDYWGEVGISMALANRAANIAERDPTLQRRIRRNLLLEKIENCQTKALSLEKEANRKRKQAATKERAAEKKMISTDARGCSKQVSEGIVETKSWDKKNDRKRVRLENEAAKLQQEAATLLKEADGLFGDASTFRNEEATAQSELAQLERPLDDDQTIRTTTTDHSTSENGFV